MASSFNIYKDLCIFLKLNSPQWLEIILTPFPRLKFSQHAFDWVDVTHVNKNAHRQTKIHSRRAIYLPASLMEAENFGHKLLALFLVLLCFALAFHGVWRVVMGRFLSTNALWGGRERRVTRRVRIEFPLHVKLLPLATFSSCLPPFTMDKMAANLNVATGQGARPV